MMEKKTLNPVIYKTTNLINGKIYIGQDRYNNPKYFGSGIKLNDSIKHYSKENFKKEILEQCSIEELNEREVYWIAFYDSMNMEIGYNLTSGGKQYTEICIETKKKMSKAALNKPKSIETKQRLSDARLEYLRINGIPKRKPLSDLTKQKILETKRKNKLCH